MNAGRLLQAVCPCKHFRKDCVPVLRRTATRCAAPGTRSTLFRRDPRQFAGRCHLAAQPFRSDVETVRPNRRAEFQEHAGKIGLVTQRFEHGPGFVHHSRKVVHAFAAVAEAKAQAKTAELFETGYLSQHRGLRSVRAEA